METMKKEKYGAIDIVKFLFAILIVCAHYISEYADGRINKFIEYASSLYIIVVPFFFVCSGFLLFTKVLSKPSESEAGKNLIKNYIKRIFFMYIGWSCIYVSFKIVAWVKFGCSIEEILQYIIKAILYSTYATIWFLPALCIGILITWFFVRRKWLTGLIITANIAYLIGAMGVSYSFLVENSVFAPVLETYNYFFGSTRNGFFNGFPFVALGAYIAYYNIHKTSDHTLIKHFIFSCVFSIAFVIEACILKFGFNTVNANTLIMLVPFTYYFFSYLIDIPIKSNKCFKWMRKMSTTIFLCQRIFLTAIPSVSPKGITLSVLNGNPYVGLIFLLFMVLITAEVIIAIGRKNNVVAKLC